MRLFIYITYITLTSGNIFAKNPIDYLKKIVTDKKEWSVPDKNAIKDCQAGQAIALTDPPNSYMIGSRISFFNVNEGTQITKEQLYKDCEVSTTTTYKNNILASVSYKKCPKKNKEKLLDEKIIFLSEQEFTYIKDSEKCTYRVSQ